VDVQIQRSTRLGDAMCCCARIAYPARLDRYQIVRVRWRTKLTLRPVKKSPIPCKSLRFALGGGIDCLFSSFH